MSKAGNPSIRANTVQITFKDDIKFDHGENTIRDACTLETVMTTRASEVLITIMLKAHITCKSTTENVGSNGFIITRTNFVTLRYRTDRLDASS